MRRFVVLIVAVLSFCGVATSAFAHELIVKPSKMEAARGEILPIELQSVHKFIVKEEVEDVARIKAGIFRNGRLEEAALKGNDAELRIDYSVKIEDDGAVLVLANKDGEIWSITNEGGKVGGRKELEAQGFKVKSASKNDKFAKAVVNASHDDKNFATPVGQELEIVPVTNPADARVGEYLQVKVLFKGQPAAVPVWATYDGFALPYAVTYAYYTETDSDGIAHIKITSPGLWIVRAAKDGEPGVEGEYDVRNLRSILTFEVK